MTIKEKLDKIHSFNTIIKFEDHPDFTPDFKPIEMFWLGIFGGNYYQISSGYESIPNEFLEEVNLETQKTRQKDLWFHFKSNFYLGYYSVENNLFEVKCGSSYEQWIDKNWIYKIDPNGWVEWYTKFYYGRRDQCDKQQIKRWKSFKARHSGMLLSRCKPSEIDKCLKTRQNLLHWAIDSTKL